jgi:hypothetical protein
MNCASLRFLSRQIVDVSFGWRRGNALQVRRRYDEVIATAIRLLAHATDEALRRHSLESTFLVRARKI